MYIHVSNLEMWGIGCGPVGNFFFEPHDQPSWVWPQMGWAPMFGQFFGWEMMITY